MKILLRRSLIALLLIALAGGIAYEATTHVVRGWWNGEAFYDGRPTSWWREVVIRDIVKRPPNWIGRVTNFVPMPEKVTSLPLVGNLEAVPVLHELTGDKDERVSQFSEHFLKRAHSDSDSDFERNVDWQFYFIKLAFNSHKWHNQSLR